MVQKFYNRWFFDSNENLLKSTRNPKKCISSKSKIIVFQTPSDYYYLALYSLLITKLKNENNDIHIAGIYPETFSVRKENSFYLLRKIITPIDQYLIKIKWKKLYKKIGIEFYINNTNFNLFLKIKFIFKSFYIVKSLNSKLDVINFKIQNLNIGDLIYDTYLRFEVKPTLNIKDFRLFKYFYKAYLIHNEFEQLSTKYNIDAFYSSYSTYIQHGIGVRVFLKKSINVFTSGNLQQKFKKLHLYDFFHTTNHLEYKKIFESLTDKDKLISYGHKLLKNKFNGKIDMNNLYMKKSAYNSNINMDTENLNDIVGVVFLHDFFDSPHIYDGMLFNDFYEWTIFTLDFIRKNKLKIAIKPHPNQVIESISVINHLKECYSDLIWIDSNISNLIILNSKIKFGISLYGSVLHELAYYGKTAICAGNNPHYAFNFLLKPQNIHEYENMILYSYNNKKVATNFKDEVAVFYYMHNIFNKESLNYDFSELEMYNVFNTDSNIISEKIIKWV